MSTEPASQRRNSGSPPTATIHGKVLGKLYHHIALDVDGIQQYLYEHEMPAITVDVIVTVNLSVLLIRRSLNTLPTEFVGTLALPGGHLEMSDFDAKDAALRELREETGLILDRIDLTELFTASQIGRDPRQRTVSIVFMCNAEDRSKLIFGEVETPDEISQLVWLPFEKIPTEKLAFDHKDLITRALCSPHRSTRASGGGEGDDL